MSKSHNYNGECKQPFCEVCLENIKGIKGVADSLHTLSTPQTQSPDDTLRMQVNRLIVENTNLNGTYDMRGIAKDVVDLIKSDRESYAAQDVADNHLQEGKLFTTAHTEAKQALTSLIKELVAEARIDELKHLIDDDGIWHEDMTRQFPQKITLNQRIKELENQPQITPSTSSSKTY